MVGRHGMFLQLGSMSVNDIIAHCEWAYVNRASFDDLCVTQVADEDGLIFTHKLDALKPYLPGGDKRAFSNVFFGTAVDYRGYTKPYDDDMLLGSFRWRQLRLQASVLRQLTRLLSDFTWHVYIEHEAALDKLIKSNLRAAYEAFLVQSVRDINEIKPGVAILWSPAFWTKTPPNSLDVYLNTFFNNIRMFGGGNGISWLHLQDCQGRWFNPSYANSVEWFNTLPSFPSKRMNVEFFEQVDGGLVPGDKQEIEARLAFYAANNIPLGISWEARWIKRVWEQVSVPQDIGEALIGTSSTVRANNIWPLNRSKVRTFLSTRLVTGNYSARAEAAGKAAKLLRAAFPLEVQGAYYMRPYVATVLPGRAVNSDHLTAGAIDIFFRKAADKQHLAEVKRILDRWKARGVVRYYIDLGANWAHRDHIHVSFQLGVKA